MAKKALLKKVLAEIDEIDRLNEAHTVDLTPYRTGLTKLEQTVAGYFDDFREQFLIEIADASEHMFMECLQNLFEIYWGDDLADEIRETCKLGDDDADLAVFHRIHSQLLRHVATIALSA